MSSKELKIHGEYYDVIEAFLISLQGLFCKDFEEQHMHKDSNILQTPTVVFFSSVDAEDPGYTEYLEVECSAQYSLSPK